VWVDDKGGPIHVKAQFRGIETGKYELFLVDATCTTLLDDMGTFSVGDDGDTCNTSIPGLPSSHCGEGVGPGSLQDRLGGAFLAVATLDSEHFSGTDDARAIRLSGVTKQTGPRSLCRRLVRTATTTGGGRAASRSVAMAPYCVPWT
jgi:hypothetical protein